MSRPRIIYISLLVILAALMLSSSLNLFKSMGRTVESNELNRGHLLDTGDEYIIEFDIMNPEIKDMRYQIEVVLDGKSYGDTCIIKPGGLYTYIQHIRPEAITEGKAQVSIFKEGAQVPVGQTIYYLE